MANSPKKNTGKYKSFRLPFILFCISCTISVTQFILCKQFQKFMRAALTCLLDILAVLWETQNKKRGKFLQTVPLFYH